MSRRDIYYWKCDRPAAFHGTAPRDEREAQLVQPLTEALRAYFNTREINLHPALTQGNHVAFYAVIHGRCAFIRVEDGPERDGHLTVESVVLKHVRETGVRTPAVLGCDATRKRVPFAWQALERISSPDLNHWFKAGTLDLDSTAFQIGEAIAKWQNIVCTGFGSFDHALSGGRSAYADYFHLRLDAHLHFLQTRGFLKNTDEIRSVIEDHGELLSVDRGCLVHKDLALWNILGTQDRIDAFIDFDDAISGDPTDDLSLLACFHDAAFLRRAAEGYQSVRPLPAEYRRRLWLHLLRNMIVKAVIRVGAGYFERTDGFFLIGTGRSGADLERTTRERLATAVRGLRENLDISIL